MTTAAKARLGAPLVSAAYCVGTLLVLVSLLELGRTIWPFVPGSVEWRYGAAGLLAGYTLTPMLGGLLLTLAAAIGGQRRALRAIGAAHLVAGVLLLFVLGGFALDALQVRRQTAPEAQVLTEVGSVHAALKLGLTLVALTWVGIAAIRQARGGAAASVGSGPELVVGR